MSAWPPIAAWLAVMLLTYLFVALLSPESFD